MNKKRKKLIRSIEEKIEDITIDDRIIILNMICSKIGREKIFFEGTGCRLLFKIIPYYLLEEINEFINEAKKKTQLSF